MLKKKIIIVLLVCLLVSTMAISIANAADYPERPINCIISYSPGGGSDVMARLIQPYLEKYLGVSFLNVYKPGAGGAVGWTYFSSKTIADGYSICIINIPSIISNIVMHPDEINYTIDDFVPLYNVIEDPGLLFVGKESKFNSATEFIEYAKANPGRVTIAHSGVGTDDWIRIKMLEKEAGIELILVPFPGSGPAWQATMGGHVDICSDNMSIVYQQIIDGSLKPLSVMADERVEWLPDVPTLKEELGYACEFGSGRGYAVKKGTSKEIIDVLEAAFEKAINDPDFITMAKEMGFPVYPLNSLEYTKYINNRAELFERLYRETME